MRRKSAELRREEVVQAALALLAVNGPGALTTEAIAGEVGVSQATLFKHFPSKGASLVACVDWIGDRVGPAVDAALAARGSAEERLRATIGAMFRVAETIPAMPTAMFSRELHVEFPDLRGMIRERRRKFADALAQLLGDGASAGEFAADLNVRAGAYLVIGLVQGLLLRRHQGEQGLDLVAEASAMLDILLHGLRRR
jgi:AcrR family transcriptional regulator